MSAQPFHRGPDGEPGLNYLCAGYKRFFTHVDRPRRIMADRISRSRFADEIMQMQTSPGGSRAKHGTRPGRNDRCPRGNGMKFKHCHGRIGGPAVLSVQEED